MQVVAEVQDKMLQALKVLLAQVAEPLALTMPKTMPQPTQAAAVEVQQQILVVILLLVTAVVV
jgi:hypothetical protein